MDLNSIQAGIRAGMKIRIDVLIWRRPLFIPQVTLPKPKRQIARFILKRSLVGYLRLSEWGF
jgi:hypothetical protein